jgi:hypothetical protein
MVVRENIYVSGTWEMDMAPSSKLPKIKKLE